VFMGGVSFVISMVKSGRAGRQKAALSVAPAEAPAYVDER
jgi:hypothetical protein